MDIHWIYRKWVLLQLYIQLPFGLPLPLFPLAEYPDPARSQGLSNGLSTWQVGSGWFRWVGNPLSLELLKWNQKQGQVDPHLFIITITHTQCPSFPFVSHIFLPLFDQSVHTSNLQKVNQTQILKPLTCVTYACWYTCPT